MSQAVTCPVCYGTGIYKSPSSEGTAVWVAKTCHGCDGRGWVEVGKDNPWPDPVPSVPYWPWYPNPQPIWYGEVAGTKMVPPITFTQ